MANSRPDYEALDAQGYPYMREAKVVGELPLADRRPALDAALAAVSNSLGMPARKALSFGLPVFEAFDLNRREAGRHEQAALLMTQGVNLSLDYIPAYALANVSENTQPQVTNEKEPAPERSRAPTTQAGTAGRS
jgi:hypothetical protein